MSNSPEPHTQQPTAGEGLRDFRRDAERRRVSVWADELAMWITRLVAAGQLDANFTQSTEAQLRTCVRSHSPPRGG